MSTTALIVTDMLNPYVRHFSIKVPRDAVACIDPELGQAALRMMERNMRAEIVTAGSCLP